MTYYVISVEGAEDRTLSLDVMEYKQLAYLAPHVRLCGWGPTAYIESRELAEQFAEACWPILQGRYGNHVRLTARECTCSDHRKGRAKMAMDSKTVRARLATGNFAPNNAPIVEQ